MGLVDWFIWLVFHTLHSEIRQKISTFLKDCAILARVSSTI